MKTFLLVLLSFLTNVIGAAAENLAGSIVSVDAKAQTFSVAAGMDVHTYRVRPSTEIVVNGTKARFEALGAGMQVKLVTSEPGVAAKVTATTLAPAGRGEAARPKLHTKLEKNLVGTKWDWRTSPDRPSGGLVLSFAKDQAAFSNAPETKLPWKALDETTIQLGTQRVTFKADLSELQCPGWAHGAGRWAKRLP